MSVGKLIQHGTPQTTKLLLSLFKSSSSKLGLSTADIFQKVHTMYPDAYCPAPPLSLYSSRTPLPPFPNHPIRSVKYLKGVLKELEEQRLIEKVCLYKDPDGRVVSKGDRKHDSENVGVVTPLKELETMGWRWRSLKPETP
ncbi:hypothetical protein C8R43DRAFT_971350 [Mycena crocata]|nr:hypothetical protein C8R43DRAFT_971350 [Mycena crocata]